MAETLIALVLYFNVAGQQHTAVIDTYATPGDCWATLQENGHPYNMDCVPLAARERGEGLSTHYGADTAEENE